MQILSQPKIGWKTIFFSKINAQLIHHPILVCRACVNGFTSEECLWMWMCDHLTEHVVWVVTSLQVSYVSVKGCAPKIMLEHHYKTNCVCVKKWHYYRKGVKGHAKWKYDIGIVGRLKHIILQQLPKHKFTCWRLLERRIQGSWRKQYTGGYEDKFQEEFWVARNIQVYRCVHFEDIQKTLTWIVKGYYKN
jgi:hypothetical protein